MLFHAINPGSRLPFVELFFSLFKSHIASEWLMVIIKGNNKKVENKVSGRVRVGVGRALLSQ